MRHALRQGLDVGTVVVGVLWFSSCASAGHNSRFERNLVSVDVVEDSVRIGRSSESISFNVDAVIRNDLSRRILFGYCRIATQRLIDTVWQTVWTPSCLTSLGYHSIPPGGILPFRVEVYASLKPDNFPLADPRLAQGRYRLLLEFLVPQDSTAQTPRTPHSAADAQTIAHQASSVFTVVD
jgi:hypothetical protein